MTERLKSQSKEDVRNAMADLWVALVRVDGRRRGVQRAKDLFVTVERAMRTLTGDEIFIGPVEYAAAEVRCTDAIRATPEDG